MEKLSKETDQIKELQRQIVEINQKIGKANPYDLTEEIEEFKQRNSDKQIESTRKVLARDKLQNELIAKGIPWEEVLKRTLPRPPWEEEASASG